MWCVSAHLPARCPFTPSCSAYAASAFERFGFWRGLALTVGRLWCCRTNVAWGTALLLDSVPAERAGTASGVLNTSRQVGGALAIAVFGALRHTRGSSMGSAPAS